MQRAALGALDQQLRVVAAGALRHGGRHRAQQAHRRRRPRDARAPRSENRAPRRRSVAEVAHRGETAEGRPRRLLALGERGAREAVVALREQVAAAADGREIRSGSAPRRLARRARRGRRPARWSARAARRARKSVLKRPWSALSTTTSVTFGKSWPLVTICVPTRMRASPAGHALHGRLHVAAAAHHVAIEAHQRRVGKQLAQASPRCARCPGRRARTAKPHCGQLCGSGASAPQ